MIYAWALSYPTSENTSRLRNQNTAQANGETNEKYNNPRRIVHGAHFHLSCKSSRNKNTLANPPLRSRKNLPKVSNSGKQHRLYSHGLLLSDRGLI
jgi:hypothetical protein